MRAIGSIFAAALALAATSNPDIASATTMNGITVTNQNIFGDSRSINDVGIAQGDVLQFGGDIAGGSAGYSAAGIFTPTGAPAPTITQALKVCGPVSVDEDACARSSPVTAASLNGTWQFEVQSPPGPSGTTSTATFALPAVNVIPATPVPFPLNVTITNSASGVNPTINWTLRAGYTPDAFQIEIYDRSAPLLANNTANIISTADLSSGATSYTIPSTLSTGQHLNVGDNYTIGFQLITTRDRSTNIAGNANILTRSDSFFDFTPELGTTTPTNISLPMVDVNGVYHFDVGGVRASSVTFIDPEIAIGYIYQTGTGDPNFASVILPDIGGGVFDLSYLSINTVLDAGQQLFFPTDGVSEFTVTGIDPSADLDPANTSAFVTGLTFVTNGSFTGTMTPITESVSAAPEPASITLLASGLLGLRLLRRRRRVGCPTTA